MPYLSTRNLNFFCGTGILFVQKKLNDDRYFLGQAK